MELCQNVPCGWRCSMFSRLAERLSGHEIRQRPPTSINLRCFGFLRWSHCRASWGVRRGPALCCNPGGPNRASGLAPVTFPLQQRALKLVRRNVEPRSTGISLPSCATETRLRSSCFYTALALSRLNSIRATLITLPSRATSLSSHSFEEWRGIPGRH